ncbi:MAG: FAD:protein FMN transferase [Sulfurospirillaceae bacterium]|nr:FAD:protein FMN transferase [Sulfurospirillaceae bacterium]
MYRYHFTIFTTPCELYIGAASKLAADNAMQKVFAGAKALEEKYNYFKNSSQLYQVNNRSHNELELDTEFIGILKLCLFYTSITEGAFDIAMAGTLKELNLAKSAKEYEKKLKKLLPFASSKEIKIQDNRVIFSNDLTKIDFGGVVKEYAADQSILTLKKEGIDSALVNFGGDIATLGCCDTEKWRIGIQDPKNADKNINIIELDGNSLCTSGHSKRFKKIDGKKISHIIAKKKNNIEQISIIAPTTVDAGIWSTAMLVNPTLLPPAHLQVTNITYTDED